MRTVSEGIKSQDLKVTQMHVLVPLIASQYPYGFEKMREELRVGLVFGSESIDEFRGP